MCIYTLSLASAHATCEISSGLASGSSWRSSAGSAASSDGGTAAETLARPQSKLETSWGVKSPWLSYVLRVNRSVVEVHTKKGSEAVERSR